jgi:hypothetical protein
MDHIAKRRRFDEKNLGHIGPGNDQTLINASRSTALAALLVWECVDCLALDGEQERTPANYRHRAAVASR